MGVRARKRSKKTDREQDEITRLEKEIRELKALNRSLMKQLKKLAKGIHREEALEALEKLEEPTNVQKEEPKNLCEECGRGRLKESIIVGRRFLSCTVCDWKSGRVR